MNSRAFSLSAPMLALWSLGGGIGLPVVFATMGYLVDRGHVTIFALPAVALRADTVEWFYLGALFTIVTLRLLLFSWFGLVWITLAAFVYSFSQIKLQKRHCPRTANCHGLAKNLCNYLSEKLYRFRASMLGLVKTWSNGVWVFGIGVIAVAVASVSLSVPAYQTNLFVQMQAGDVTALHCFYEHQDWRWLRELVYQGYSLLALGLLASLPWLIQILAANRGFSLTISMTASVAALILFTVLNWPMVFGRLVLPYERPVLEIQHTSQSAKAIALSTRRTVWLLAVLPKTSTANAITLQALDVSKIQGLQVKDIQNVFTYVREKQNKKLEDCDR